jgi:4-hydroxyproline epimerase
MQIQVVDSHTGGEPTRVIVGGMPELSGDTLAEKLNDFRLRFDHLRRGVVCEPRGSDVVVGALICESRRADCVAGVIFFNNVGFLGMCGHGTIGVAETLKHLGKLKDNVFCIETPVGVIEVSGQANGNFSLKNVPARRTTASVSLDIEGYGKVVGDIAWGGNWFFLVKTSDYQVPTLEVLNAATLVAYTTAIKDALEAQSIFGDDGGVIDHVELFSSANGAADSRNFVLCPGNAYDRSPCGTGTSAKMACLYADGKLAAGQVWRQESVTGSIFEGSVSMEGEHLIPTISGRAYICSESTLIFDETDPFCWGIQ